MKRLSELEPGTIARIHSFEKNELFLKLMEMGCVPGELIRVDQIAPLGDPISITVAGYNLSLRLDEAVGHGAERRRAHRQSPPLRLPRAVLGLLALAEEDRDGDGGQDTDDDHDDQKFDQGEALVLLLHRLLDASEHRVGSF